MDPTTATGVNLLKARPALAVDRATHARTARLTPPLEQGKSDPKLGPDEEYPPWLWTLTAPQPMEAELQRKLQEAGYTGKPGPHSEELPISIEEAQRLLYLQRKRTIKGSNGRTSKAA